MADPVVPWLYPGFHAKCDLQATEKYPVNSCYVSSCDVTVTCGCRMAYRSLLYVANA